MSKIRKLLYFDKKSVPEMISFLNNGANDSYINKIMFNPLIYFHHLLPLRLKYMPESFVLKENKSVKALATVTISGGKEKRAEIKKLFFEEHAYNVAAELVQYVVSRYKAMGAFSVMVKADDYLPELISMLVSKCGFSHLSYEKLWRITKLPETEYDKREFRHFRNSDAQAIASIYNDSLMPNFRPLLSKESSEYKETMFKGLSYKDEYKYTIIDKKSKNITGCLTITTTDNNNYVIDIIQTSWTELSINELLAFAADKIKKRKKHFGLFVKTKKYTALGESYDNVFINNGYECVQNQLVLTNSSARILKAEERTGKYTILNDFYPSNAMPV